MTKWHILAIACALGACATKRPSPAATENLKTQATAALNEMITRDPGLQPLLSQSAGYAVFPSVGAAGALVAGGAYGKGILYENGMPTGYVEVKQGSVGLELGGQSYAELIVLQDRQAIDTLKSGAFRLGADISAVVLKSGAAASARFTHGRSVFVEPHGGLMAGVAVSGQSVAYRPLAG